MKLKSYVLIVAIFIYLPMLFGCGFRVIQSDPVLQIKQGKFQSCHTKDCGFVITYSVDPNSNDPNFQEIREIFRPAYSVEPNEPISVPYSPFEFVFYAHPVVKGKLQDGKSVKILIDTGSSAPLLAWASTIRSQKIPVQPLFGKRSGFGLCDISELNIGELRLKNLPSVFVPQHLEWHLMGLTLWKDDTVMLGLPLLRRFKYIVFDNHSQQMVFSKNASFVASEPNLWDAYPLAYTGKSKFLTTQIPMAGVNTRIGFDSGGGYMVLKEAEFELLRDQLDILSVKKGTFPSVQRGPLNCRKVRVRNFTIGNNTLKPTTIIVLPDDTQYTEQGYLSLREFKNTIVVLDFENSLMWVRKEN